MFELRHLRALVAIQKRGTLAAAARDIHVSQSALSHTLLDLERVLGQGLLHRKVKPLRFTAPGLRLLALAREILPAIDATEADLRRMERGSEGRLLLSMECHSCFDWLLPTLNAYRSAFPEVELDVRIGMPFDPYPALKERVVDVLFSTDPTRDPDVHFAPLFRYQSVLICSPRHPLAKKRFIQPEDLSDETVITYPVEPKRLDFFSRFLAPAQVEPRRVRHTELTMMIVQLVASGQGVAALPSWAVHGDVQAGVVRSLSLGKAGLWCDLWAALRAEEAAQPYVQRFLETARQVSFASLTGVEAIPSATGRARKRGAAARGS